MVKNNNENRQIMRAFGLGALHVLPLCLAVIPWGILAGSMAVDAGLTFAQSVGMSAIIFAGAAQLVTLGLVISGAGMLTIIVSVFFITAQHLLYGLTLRPYVAHLKWYQRITIGFLLTDELFAVSAQPKVKLTPAYMIGAGLCFYLAWVAVSIVGIIMASQVSDLSRYHLDFSIVATLLAIVIPLIKTFSTLVGVIVSFCLSIVFNWLNIEGGVVIGGLTGMFIAVCVAKIRGEQK
ncbi:AzlC family ABC transporter permease [Proteus vulgaris]|jgi:predicted branched-subunit amino acid permease|nr:MULTISPECIES: AzlC family ABC transporter permease [Proteus]NBN60867.1 branched-chain amino acid ABC transporter permease [Proteus sp. G2639]RNT29119.1 branched-chain amino acid ABC transporter permease [Proteus mirabilis]AYY80629.1 branched-chain amino acid ABC transporter permease [Proteus vulgaris]MBG5969693.1 AzlC family ABC transporter permease [Proteus vulgaris]MBG5983394.1 AzlC family ABC transporter permease [Proteus vulgaris]